MNAAASAMTFDQRIQALQTYVLHHLSDSHVLKLPFFSISLPDWISVHGLMLMLSALFLIWLFGVVYRKNAPVPSGMTNLLEMFIAFIRDLHRAAVPAGTLSAQGKAAGSALSTKRYTIGITR